MDSVAFQMGLNKSEVPENTSTHRGPFALRKSLWLPVFSLYPCSHQTGRQASQEREKRTAVGSHGWNQGPKVTSTRLGSQPAGPGVDQTSGVPATLSAQKSAGRSKVLIHCCPQDRADSLAKTHWPGISDLAPASRCVSHLLMHCSLCLGPRFSLCSPGSPTYPSRFNMITSSIKFSQTLRYRRKSTSGPPLRMLLHRGWLCYTSCEVMRTGISCLLSQLSLRSVFCGQARDWIKQEVILRCDVD